MVKDDWPPPRYCRLECHLIFLSSDLAWTWWKMIELHPQVLQTRNSPKVFLHSDIAWTWWKMIELHPGTADQNITSNFYTFRFSLDMVKDDWPPPRYCRPEYHLKCFKFRFSLDMVKDDWTPPRYCRPEYHLNFFNSDLAWTWWKMIELHQGNIQTRISHTFLFTLQI